MLYIAKRQLSGERLDGRYCEGEDTSLFRTCLLSDSFLHGELMSTPSRNPHNTRCGCNYESVVGQMRASILRDQHIRLVRGIGVSLELWRIASIE